MRRMLVLAVGAVAHYTLASAKTVGGVLLTLLVLGGVTTVVLLIWKVVRWAWAP